MSARLGTFVLCMLILLPACAPRDVGKTLARSGRNVPLHVVVGETLRAIDPETGALRFERNRAVATPDRTLVVASTPDGEGTRIDHLVGDTGSALSSYTIPGSFKPAAVAPRSGLVAAIAAVGVEGRWLAPAREQTDLVVADTVRREHRLYRLPGNYVPEVFSFAQDRLFLVEYLAPDRYRVRQLDLASGAITPVGARDKRVTAEEEMRGRSRSQVMAPDQTRLYTLYVREDKHLHLRDFRENGGSGHPDRSSKAFVHVLSLTEGWAYCLDLPLPFGGGPVEALALAISPDGRSLYIADAASGGRIATADTQSLRISQVRSIASAIAHEIGDSTILHAAADGTLYLAVGRELITLDSRIRVQNQHTLAEPPSAIEISTDNARLFAVGPTRLTVFATRPTGMTADLPRDDGPMAPRTLP